MSEYLYLIAKADREKSEYRASVMNKFPGKREKALDVHYRRGSGLRRTGRVLGYGEGSGAAGGLAGGAAGGGIGGLIGRAAGKGHATGAALGASVGSSIGALTAGTIGHQHAQQRNLDSGDIKLMGRGKHAGKRVKSQDFWTGKPKWRDQ